MIDSRSALMLGWILIISTAMLWNICLFEELEGIKTPGEKSSTSPKVIFCMKHSIKELQESHVWITSALTANTQYWQHWLEKAKCFKPAFFVSASRGRLHRLQKKSDSLWENDPSSQLIHRLSKRFPEEFVISVCMIKSSSVEHDLYLVNYGPV